MPTPKKFAVYRASAGSGKTFTLVREYLTIAMNGDDSAIRHNFRQILAITFTNKATNQMKERILATLSAMQDPALRDGKEDNMAAALCKALEITDRNELSRRAAILQKAILHNYSDFSVCTIDSFMNRIVRTFAVDLGLSPRFEISMDIDTVLDAAVDKLFADISDEHPDLTRILLQFAKSKMEDGNTFNVYHDLNKASKNIINENILEKLSKLQGITLQQFCNYADTLRKRIRKYEEDILKIAKEIVSNAAEYGFSDNDFSGKTRGTLAYFSKLNNNKEIKLPSSTVIQYVNKDMVLNDSGLRNPKAQQLKEQVEKAISEISEGYKDYLTHKALMMNVFQMALLKDIKDKMSEYYSENETMLISENNKRVSEQVKNEEAPFIFERLGCRYKHFLIDEFQDTSIMQWQNLMPLLVNGLSEGQRSLIVGDGKQAIYRFRQGDVEQFQHITTPPANATDVIKHHYKTIGANCTIEELDTNYRSAGNIVEFNNRFFTFLESQLYQQSPNHLMRDIYVGSNPDSPTLVQRVGPGKAGKGYVEVDLIEKERLADEAPRRIYDILCHLREAGYRYKDVAILSRTNGKLSELNLRLMSINEQEGKLPDLQFSSADSLKLSQNPDSKFLRSLLKYVHDNNNAIAKLEIAEYLFGKGIAEFDSSVFATKGRFEALLAQHFAAYDRDRLLSQTIYDCGCNLVRVFDIPHTPYIYTFLNQIDRYSERNRTNFGHFLEWLDENWNNLSTVTSDDLDAVSLMSVHKSKGLEFDVVIYFMDNNSNHRETIWVDVDNSKIGMDASGIEQISVGMVNMKKELAETHFCSDYDNEKVKRDIDKLNVVYVAMTRPKLQLYVVAESANTQNDTRQPPASHTSLLEAYLKREGTEFVNQSITNSQGEEIAVKYCYGKFERVEKTQSSLQTALPLKTNQTLPWFDRIKIVGRSDSIMQPQMEQQQVGNIVHEILSKVGTLDDALEVARKWLAEQKLDKEVSDRVMVLVDSVLRAKDVRRFFDAEYSYKTECDMLCKGEIVRPDRIVFAGNETWVVDFKTGSHVEKYKEQVRGYMAVLEEMGYANVKGFLLYIGDEGCSVEEV
ncbi:MAG: UvrD-helicase domain-containing protein [Bacteroidales bacterium]|nr:UvrD-helicase domain-containing protein [Bacteroidales bacterium]